MGSSILQSRDGQLLVARPANANQSSDTVGSGLYGKALEISEYDNLTMQIYWAGVTSGSGNAKVQLSLKAAPTAADWVDAPSGSVNSTGASGSAMVTIPVCHKSARVVWTLGTASAGTVTAEVMAKSF